MPRRTTSAAEMRTKHDRRAGDLQAAKHDQGHQEEDDQKRAYLVTREQSAPKHELSAKQEEQRAHSDQQYIHCRALNASEQLGYP